MIKWDALVRAREQMHLSQAEAAEHFKVGLVTYQRWESGRVKPQPQHLRRLYDTFGIRLGGVYPSLPDAVPDATNAIIDTTHVPTKLLPDRTEESFDRLQAFVMQNMTTHLWSLALMEHLTCNAKRRAIRQAIKDFDAMNTDNKNYHISRRDALYSLASLPLITFGLSAPGKVISPAHYDAVIAHCTASLEACWELSRSGDIQDVMLTFQSVSRYLTVLDTMNKSSSRHRKQGLELAAHYAILKTFVGRQLVGPAEAIQYATYAAAISKETGDISLQLISLNKLAGTYFFDKQDILAEKVAKEAESLLHQYERLPNSTPLHPSITGETYSTIALVQSKNRRPSDAALQKAIDIDPGNESSIFTDFKRSSLLIDTGWAYCYRGDQYMAMKQLEQRVDPETLRPRFSQSATGHLETIHIMALSSLKSKEKDMEKTIHFWKAEIEGAKAVRSELAFDNATSNYELMEAIWPNESRITELHDYIVHWE